MAIRVTCKIIVDEVEYEVDSVNRRVFTITQNVSSTGTFSDTPALLVSDFISTASKNATKEADTHLRVLKGDF